MCANPFIAVITQNDWNSEGHTLKHFYKDETMIPYSDQEWVYDQSQSQTKIQGPREYTQTLSRIMNVLIKEGFLLSFLIDARSCLL